METITEPLPNPFLKTCKKPGFRQQFGRPQGRLGALVGHLMAFKNRKVNDEIVDALEVSSDDHVLEIGFGPGVTLQTLAQRASRVAGADPSEVMVRQASRRNRAAIEAERLVVKRASVSTLPFGDDEFTKVVAINSFHHWPQPELDLKEVKRVLRPGGLLVLGLRMKAPTKKRLAPPGFTEREIRDIEELLRRVGFHDVASKLRTAGSERVVAVKAYC